MGGGFGGGIGHVGLHHGIVAATISRHRTGSLAMKATEDMLEAAGESIPKRPNWLMRLWREFKQVRKERRTPPQGLNDGQT